MVTLTQIQNALVDEDVISREEILAVQLVARIRHIRIEEGISQSELSRSSGVPQKTISRMENSLSMPKLSTLIKLVESLDYVVDFSITKKNKLFI